MKLKYRLGLIAYTIISKFGLNKVTIDLLSWIERKLNKEE
jgi:hypothetical protein